MLAIFVCLAGIFALLVISELLDQKKILHGDQKRKFIHTTCGAFIAFWPWLISFETIAWIGVAMLLVVLLNHRVRVVDFHSNLNRETYGDIFFALAIISSALMTDQEVYFAVAMLVMAVGDTVANLAGKKFGKRWGYHVLGHHKTVIGSMAMWLVSLAILGIGILFAYDSIGFSSYVSLIVFLPPLLVVIENFSPIGFDNLLVPVFIIAALNSAQ